MAKGVIRKSIKALGKGFKRRSKEMRNAIRMAKKEYRKAQKEIRLVKDELKKAQEDINAYKRIREFTKNPTRISNQTVREEIASRKKNIQQSQTTAEKLIRDLEARGYSVDNREEIMKGPKNIYGANFTSYLTISDPDRIKRDAYRSGIPTKTSGNVSTYYDTIAKDLIYSLDKMPSDRRGRMAFELITMSDETNTDITAGLPDGINFYNFLSKKSIIQKFQKNVDKDTLINVLETYENKDPKAFNEMLDFLYNDTRAAYAEQYEDLQAERKAKTIRTLRDNNTLIGDFSDEQLDKLMDLFETPEWNALKNNWKQFEEWYSREAFDELVKIIKTEGVSFDVDKFAALVASHGDLIGSVDEYLKVRTKGDD